MLPQHQIRTLAVIQNRIRIEVRRRQAEERTPPVAGPVDGTDPDELDAYFELVEAEVNSALTDSAEPALDVDGGSDLDIPARADQDAAASGADEAGPGSRNPDDLESSVLSDDEVL